MPDTLHAVFNHERRFVGLLAEDEGKVLCVFSKRVLAERWLMDMKLEQHIVSKELYPDDIARLCDDAMTADFKYAAINPPLNRGQKVQMGTLLSLKEQAVKKSSVAP